MTPLDYIKEGILKGNWETVCEGYERLTGEALRLPKRGRPKENKKKIKEKRITGEEDSFFRLDETQRTNIQKETGGIQLITNSPSLGEIESNRIKAEEAQRNKVTIARPVVQTYNAECNECGKIFKSDRPNGEIGQKCLNCLKAKKSRFT